MSHKNHYAACGYCGWVGKESELIDNKKNHSCGADKCPECGVEDFISCCYKSYEGAESMDELDIYNAPQENNEEKQDNTQQRLYAIKTST